MNEEAIRALVREAVTRQLAGTQHRAHHAAPAPAPLMLVADPSHYRYSNLPESGGPCFIEPGVGCNHCGYCQSHGH